jgi:hypothetical protein
VFVKRRTSKHCAHYSQYDDIHGNEEHTNEERDKETKIVKMYKSQEGRQPDY